MRRFLVSPAALALAVVTSPGIADAAEWIRTTTPPSAEPAEAIAEAFVAGAGRDPLRLGDAQLVRTRALPMGRQSVVRFEQRHRGLVVEARSAALRVTGDGRVRVAMVDVARDLDVDTTPALDADAGLEAARATLFFPIGRELASELVVFADGAQGRLAWRIDARDPRGGVRLLVDAHDGTLLGQRPVVSDAMGRVYTISSVVTPTPADVELSTLDTTVTPIHLDGWNGLLQVTNYVSGGQQDGYEVEQTVEPSAGENFLYDPPVDLESAIDEFAQVNLFHHLTTHREFFRDDLGVDVDDAAWQVTAVANMQESGQPLDNAFFSPQGLSGNGELDAPNLIGIGQGSVDFAYDSDVFKHEFGHYISHNAVGYNLGQVGITEYGFSPHSGSVDEGIADYFACSENDDPILGEATLAVLSAARDLTDTAKTCPGDMVGEVHADGEIVGSLAWTIREEFGREVADRMVWGAVALMPVGGTLGDFATGLSETASGLVDEGELEAADLVTLEGLIAARGLDACDDVLPLDGEDPVHMTIIGLDVVGQAFGADCAQLQSFGIAIQSIFHFSAEAPGGAAAQFHLDVEPLGAGEVSYRLFVRNGQHVGFDDGGMTGLPSPDVFDYDLEASTPSLDLVVDAASDPPFDPSATYFAVVMSSSCATLSADIRLVDRTGEGGGGATSGVGGEQAATVGAGNATVGSSAAAGGGEGGSGDGVEAEGDGCGCRTARDQGPVGGAMVAIGALAAIAARRLRRRS